MKGLLLLSGGIDSPVAAHLLIGQIHVDMIHFYEGEKSIGRCRVIAERLARLHRQKVRLIAVNPRKSLEPVLEFCNRRMTCLLCKRLMLRVSERADLITL